MISPSRLSYWCIVVHYVTMYTVQLVWCAELQRGVATFYVFLVLSCDLHLPHVYSYPHVQLPKWKILVGHSVHVPPMVKLTRPTLELFTAAQTCQTISKTHPINTRLLSLSHGRMFVGCCHPTTKEMRPSLHYDDAMVYISFHSKWKIGSLPPLQWNLFHNIIRLVSMTRSVMDDMQLRINKNYLVCLFFHFLEIGSKAWRGSIR